MIEEEERETVEEGASCLAGRGTTAGEFTAGWPPRTTALRAVGCYAALTERSLPVPGGNLGDRLQDMRSSPGAGRRSHGPLPGTTKLAPEGPHSCMLERSQRARGPVKILYLAPDTRHPRSTTGGAVDQSVPRPPGTTRRPASNLAGCGAM